MNLQRAIQLALEGKAILFAGAGFALGATNVKGDPFKTGRQLAKHFAASSGLSEDTPLDAAAEEVAHQKGVDPLIAELKVEFKASSVEAHHLEVSRVPWKRIYTTNYDNVLELAHGQVSRALTPVTSSNDIRKTPKEHLAVHLNGFIDALDRDSLWTSFKLTETSYSSSALDTPWVDLFRHDLAGAGAVFFLGYSIADLDIKRILFDTPELHDRTFFVLGSSPDLVTRRRADVYGTVVAMDVSTFAGELAKERATYDPSNAPDPIGNSIERVEPQPHEPFSDSYVFDLLMQGRVRSEYVSASLNGLVSYFLERKLAPEIVTLAKQSGSTIVVHSELGNGKSMLLEGIMHRVAQSGRPVYRIHTRTDDLFKELDTVMKASPPALLVIDGYAEWLDAAEYIGLNANPALSLLLSARTTTNDLRLDDLTAVVRRESISEIGVDVLHENDIRWLNTYLEQYGLWGDKTSWSWQRRNGYLKTRCGAEFSGVLLMLLESPTISARFNALLESVRERRDNYDILLTVLILTVLQYPATMEALIDIWGARVIDSSFRSDPAVREVCDTVQGRIVLRSTVAAQHILTRVADASAVVETLEHVARVSDRLGGIRPYDQVIKSLMRFSDVQAVLPEKNRAANVLRYYENIKNLGAARWNPHFWLQYAIAAMVIEDYSRAEKYFETAYSLAEKRDRYDPFMIDNHYARFLLKTSPSKADSNEALEAFRKARSIVQHQIQRERLHYPFRVALSYVEFYDAFEHKLTQDQKQEVGRAAIYVSEKIRRLPESRRDQRYVKDCATAMDGLARRIFESPVAAPDRKTSPTRIAPRATRGASVASSAPTRMTDVGKEFADVVQSVLTHLSRKDGAWVSLPRFGAALRKRIPGFEPKTYGGRNLVAVLKKVPFLEFDERGEGPAKSVYVRSKASETNTTNEIG